MKSISFSLMAILLIFSLSLPSCYVNRFTVGDGPVGRGHDRALFSKSKQMYLFWGLIGLGQSQPPIPQAGGYMIKHSFNFVDGLVSIITGGIFSMRTTKIYIFKDQIREHKLERKLDQEEKTGQ